MTDKTKNKTLNNLSSRFNVGSLSYSTSTKSLLASHALNKTPSIQKSLQSSGSSNQYENHRKNLKSYTNENFL